MEELKIDAQRIIDLMSEELSGYVSKLAVSKAQVEQLAKVIDAQSKEIASLKQQLESNNKKSK